MPPRDLGVTVNRSTRRAAALAGAALLALTACSAGSPTDPDGSGTSGSDGASGPSDETVTLGLVAEPATLDFRTGDGAAIPQLLLGNVYETLVTVDPESGEIVDALADSHEISKDRLTYTLSLIHI